MKNESIMLIGMSTPMALQVVRSLGSHGLRVYGFGSKKADIARFSRYLHKYILLQDNDFYDNIPFLLECVKKYAINYIIALGEVQISALNAHREAFEEHAKLLFPDDAKMQLVLNKNKTLEIADALGLPIPATLLIREKNDLRKIFELPLPLIAKPSYRTYQSSEKRRHDFRVKYFTSHEAAVHFLEPYVHNQYLCLIQERFMGEETCVAFLRHQQRIVAHCQFNFAVLSDTPGIPSVKEAVMTENDLYIYGEKMLDALDWEGVALFDFIKKDATSPYSLLEINGRFWGSTTLCSRAGVDFPYLLYRTVGRGETELTITTATPGIQVRNLCGVTKMYVKNVIHNKNISFFKKATAEYLKPFFKKGQHEVQLLNDPLPGIVDIIISIRDLFLKKNE